MPRIPVVDLQRSLPDQGSGTLTDAASFAIEGRQTAETWKQLGQGGEKLAQIGSMFQTKLNHARQVDELSQLKLKATKELYDFRESLDGDPNPETWTVKLEKRGQEILDAALKGSQDPEVQAALKSHWASNYPTIYHGVMSKARQQQIRTFAGNLETDYPNYIDLYNRAGTEEEQTGIKGQLFGRLEGAKAAGLIHPDKAEKLKVEFGNRVKLDAFHKAGERDPFAAMANLDAFGLDQEQRRQGIPWLEGRIAKAQQENAVVVDRAFEEGSLTPGALQGLRDGNRINLSTYRMYDGALQSGMSGRQELDVDVYMRLDKAAREGKLVGDDLDRAVKAGKLGPPAQALNNYRYLTNLQGKIEDPKDPLAGMFKKDPTLRMQFNTSLHELQYRLRPLDQNKTEQMFKKYGGLSGTPIRPEAMFENRGAVMFMDAVKAAAADPVQSKELNGDWLLKKSVEIGRALQQEAVQQGLFRTKPGRGKGAPPMSAPGATAGQGLGSPVRAPGPKTVVRGGKTYRVLVIDGKEMVDPTPLP